jgi:predicted Zn-dependent protease
MEMAALERRVGRHGKATELYKRALKISPRSLEARLGAAMVEMDEGGVQAGREKLDALVDEGIDSGLVLLEAARARTLSGDAEAAQALLDRASVDARWLNWKVARERGRMTLQRSQPIEAISELQRAMSLRPEDRETRLLLMEANYEAGNKRGSKDALQDITKSFRESSIQRIATGIHGLLSERIPEATEALIEAEDLLIKEKATGLQMASHAYWLGRCALLPWSVLLPERQDKADGHQLRAFGDH